MAAVRIADDDGVSAASSRPTNTICFPSGANLAPRPRSKSFRGTPPSGAATR